MVQIVDNDEMLEEEFDDRFGEEPDFEKLAEEDFMDNIKDEDLMPGIVTKCLSFTYCFLTIASHVIIEVLFVPCVCR